MKCAVSGCTSSHQKGDPSLSFHRFPINQTLVKAWEKFCGRKCEKNFSVCNKHFRREDYENLLKYELGFTDKLTLKKDAVPSIYETDEESIQKKQREEYKKIVDDLLRQHEEDVLSTELNCDVNYVYQEAKTTLINEALFDHEVDIKTEDYADVAFSQSNYNQSITPKNAKSSQTDGASGDCVSCGFVNITKSGEEKYFSLRCFYCATQYPIYYWSEFSNHILKNHGYLEKQFGKDDLECVTSEPYEIIEIMDDSNDEGNEEQLCPINFVNIDDIADMKENKHNTNLKKIVKEDSSDTFDAEETYQEKYVPNNEHNYSQMGLNKPFDEESVSDDEDIDEICFGKTPYTIVMDFLDHLKGLQSLWRDRNKDYDNYDRDLTSLKKIMKIKWELNLTMNSLHERLENIKTWFYNIRAAMDISGNNKIHTFFHEYYEKCAEFLPFGKGNTRHTFKCDLCNSCHVKLIKLQAHKYRKHGIGELPFSCSKCCKRFSRIEILLNHVKRHLLKRPLRKRNERLVKEKRIKGNQIIEKPLQSELTFKCYICDKSFECANEYKLHLDIHPKGDRKYACEECGGRFKDLASKDKHKNIHSALGHQCEYCDMKLASAVSFKAHMNAHKGIYEYICEWCGEKCVDRKSWKEHVQYAHLGGGICKICNRDYKRRSILHKHLKNLHRPTFGTVEELSLRFRKRKNNKRKCKSNKYEYITDPVTKLRRIKCPNCDRSFRQYKSIHRHVQQAHNYDILLMQKKKKLPKFKKPRTYFGRRPFRILNEMSCKDEETEAAVNTITECSGMKLENSVNVSNICLVTDIEDHMPRNQLSVMEMNKFESYENVEEISLDKFFSIITTNDNFTIQSPSESLHMDDVQLVEKVDTSLITKEEDFECLY
ncbi:protein suppressor of hairy wing-like [Eurosta solidaginis]|uniref:protein suppressor of hairy wing-like n=1 Tax=Eurosta solidaginis TaxID=178769 RepID=UPI0035311F9A